jgi:hypothetical protein
MAGFLDNNTIIIDAVLTDVGRQILARNDGSFSMAKFALGDDEVIYTNIRKYGQVIGDQKIKLNTPVFEALTNQSQAQKYKLVSISNQRLSRYPKLGIQTITPNYNSTSETIDLTLNTLIVSQRQSTITVEQIINSGNTILGELIDTAYNVEVNDRFLGIINERPENIDTNKIALYTLNGRLTQSGSSASANLVGGSILQFTIYTKSITEAQFRIYGNFSNKNVITTKIKITGLNSGATKEVIVNINKNC